MSASSETEAATLFAKADATQLNPPPVESAGPTLREQEYTEYKANRTEMPPDLGEQMQRKHEPKPRPQRAMSRRSPRSPKRRRKLPRKPWPPQRRTTTCGSLTSPTL